MNSEKSLCYGCSGPLNPPFLWWGHCPHTSSLPPCPAFHPQDPYAFGLNSSGQLIIEHHWLAFLNQLLRFKNLFTTNVEYKIYHISTTKNCKNRKTDFSLVPEHCATFWIKTNENGSFWGGGDGVGVCISLTRTGPMLHFHVFSIFMFFSPCFCMLIASTRDKLRYIFNQFFNWCLDISEPTWEKIHPLSEWRLASDPLNLSIY